MAYFSYWQLIRFRKNRINLPVLIAEKEDLFPYQICILLFSHHPQVFYRIFPVNLAYRIPGL
ncbi:hypothetical protein X474_26280 [Dethiosulfatarculus sandiegensis]|uniref:Uncharacterized protein n=1 Tax=Dethiosulfatarculus sandiegensis TaxID=1429043 RepID=A0A0D2IZ33_9BACT|nr:hypothetical protein X474_26280 [Dethiosulfatarculus sandiegensis]